MSTHCQMPTMTLRPFRPGMAPGRVNGSQFEPGHRQRVRVYHYWTTGEAEGWCWSAGAYDREEQRFWVRTDDGHWFELADNAVPLWTQMPPVDWMPDPVVGAYPLVTDLHTYCDRSGVANAESTYSIGKTVANVSHRRIV